MIGKQTKNILDIELKRMNWTQRFKKGSFQKNKHSGLE